MPRPLFPQSEEGLPERRILVLANAIHTDIALPVDAALLERFAFLEQAGLPLDAPDLEWLVIGWGGREFYLQTPTWSELKPMPLLRALTVDSAVMHVALAGYIPDETPGVLPLDLSEAQYQAVVDAILATFSRDGQGAPMLIDDGGYGEFDEFYEAHGVFNALVGCNVWTSSVLRQGGIRTGWWNPLPQSLLWSIKAYNSEASNP